MFLNVTGDKPIKVFIIYDVDDMGILKKKIQQDCEPRRNSDRGLK